MSNQTVIYLSEPDLKDWLKQQSSIKGVSLSRLITGYLSEAKSKQNQSKTNTFLNLVGLLNQDESSNWDEIMKDAKALRNQKSIKSYKNIWE